MECDIEMFSPLIDNVVVDDKSDPSLFDRICGQPEIIFLFEIMGIFFPFNLNEDSKKSIHYYNRNTSIVWKSIIAIWYVALRVSVIIELASPFVDSGRAMFGGANKKDYLILFLLDFAVSFQLICVWCSLYTIIYPRLTIPCSNSKWKIFKSYTLSVVVFLILNMIVISMWLFISVVYYPDELNRNKSMMVYDSFFGFVASCSATFLLTINLWFTRYDSKVCRRIIDDLIYQSQMKTLTVKSYNTARDKIKSLVDQTKMCNLLVMSSATWNIVSSLVLIFVITDNSYGIPYLVGVVLRENLYLGLVLVHISPVNEKADYFTHLVSSTTHTVDDSPAYSIARMAIAITCNERPLTFPFGFHRLTAKGALVRFGLMILSTTVAIARTNYLTFTSDSHGK